MAKKRKNPWASQAAQEALVRYGPEISALNELQREAATQLSTATAQARRGASGVVEQVAAARPGVKKIYDQAGLAQAKTATTLEGDTAALGDVANSIKAGASLEQTTGLRHLQEAKAAALTDLSNRAVAAKEGRVWAVQKAQNDFAQSLAQVLQRRSDLANEAGAFTASTEQQLQQADLDRKQQAAIASARLTQQERDSLRSAGIDPNTGRAIQNGPLDPNSPRYKGRGSSSGGAKLTPNEVGVVQDAASTALDWAKRLKGAGLGRQDTVTALVGGRKATTVPLHDPVTGKPLFNKDGTPKTKTRGGIPAIGHQVVVRAAVEQAYTGHVSRSTEKALRQRGITLKQLGLTSYAAYQRQLKKMKAPTRRRPVTRRGAGGEPFT